METNYLNTEEKVKHIKEMVKTFDISPYEIAEYTKISAMAIYNIIKDATEKPREKTLDKIIDYIEIKMENNTRLKTQEAKATYQNRDDLITDEIMMLKLFLTENFATLAKGMSETLTTARSIKKDTSRISGISREMIALKKLLKK